MKKGVAVEVRITYIFFCFSFLFPQARSSACGWGCCFCIVCSIFPRFLYWAGTSVSPYTGVTFFYWADTSVCPYTGVAFFYWADTSVSPYTGVTFFYWADTSVSPYTGVCFFIGRAHRSAPTRVLLFFIGRAHWSAPTRVFACRLIYLFNEPCGVTAPYFACRNIAGYHAACCDY